MSDVLLEPIRLVGNKSLTLNGMGYVFFDLSPIQEKFLAQECEEQKRLLEIGCGFGDVPILALERGVKEFVANDLCEAHLKILKSRAEKRFKKQQQNKIIFRQGKAPEFLKKLAPSFDAILMEKVLHFLTPQEIIFCLEEFKRLLIPGGKIYVTVGSPFSSLYEKNVAHDFLKRKKEGENFPGHFSNIMSMIKKESMEKNYHNHKVPDEMVLFDCDLLTKLFEDFGFKVLESFSLKIPTQENPFWQSCHEDESNTSGIICTF